jgi:hypothetical protein
MGYWTHVNNLGDSALSLAWAERPAHLLGLWVKPKPATATVFRMRIMTSAGPAHYVDSPPLASFAQVATWLGRRVPLRSEHAEWAAAFLPRLVAAVGDYLVQENAQSPEGEWAERVDPKPMPTASELDETERALNEALGDP